MIVIMSEIFVEQLIVMGERQHTLAQGTCFFHQGDKVTTVYVVKEGLVELTRHQQDGTSIVLQRATRQTVLAEASVYSENYHCDALVALPATLWEIPKATFIKRLREDDAFSNLWAAYLAREVQGARYRCEIMSRKTVTERLDGWLAWHGNKLPEKGQWKGVARQIGVSPEALYRELAKRRPK